MFTLPSISHATKRLAVLEFQGVGVDEEIVSLLADDVRIGVLEGIGNRLVDNEEILVMTRENMMEFMKEMDKDPLECFGECEVEVARNIGADYLISGKIIKVEQIYVLHLKLHESSRGELLAGEQAREDDLTKMLDTAITSGRTLIQKGISLSEAPTPTIVSQPSTPIQSAGIKSNENDIIVNFETEPAGAEVYVDGQFLCSRTPCQKYLAPKTYDIRFDLSRYQEEILTDIDLSKYKRTAKIRQNLKPLFGYAHITSTPNGIDLYLNGQSKVWGKTPMTQEVDPGNYTVETRDPCFERQQKKFEMTLSGEVFVDLTLDSVLTPIKVFLYDGDNAVGGSVSVDGKDVGHLGEVVQVPLCSRELIVQNGSRIWKESLYLDEGQSPEITIQMQQKSAVFDYEMVLVASGTFVMGCTTEQGTSCDNDELPSHSVTLEQDVLMGKYEVTQGLYEQVMNINPSSNTSCGALCPVESISWYEAIQFVNRMSDLEGLERCYVFVGQSFQMSSLHCNGYRLPTEAEWEYAARGGTRHVYSGSHQLAEVGWYDLNASQKIQKVGKKAPNGYGIYDMSGNVSEWVWDWFGNYDSENTKGYPMGPAVGYQRVLRGGSWSTSDKESRVSNRYFATPSHRSGDLGLRVCRTVVGDTSE